MSGVFGDTITTVTIEKHHHNTNKCLGYSAAAPEKGGINSVVAFTLTGGSGAFGTEIQITDGTVIESGSAVKTFDLGHVQVPTVGTANRNTLIEMLYGTRGTPVAATITDATDLFTSVAPGFIDVHCAATNTGAIKWTLIWSPVMASATVSAS